MNEQEINRIIEKSRKKIAISQFKKEDTIMPKTKILKMVASFILCFGIMFGVVYAGFKLESLFRINSINDKGIQTALGNGYVQNIDMDYIEKEKVKFKVDYLMMDDINFDLVFNFITKDNVDNYEGISLTGLEITDDENRQIYISSEDQKIWSKNYALSAEWWSVVEKHDNLLRQVVHLSSNNFPKSKKIYVSFNQVTLYNVNKGNPITIEYKDNYKLEFDVSKQLSQRKTVEYKTVTNQDKVRDIKLTNSALALTIKSNKYINKDENYTITDENGNIYKLADTQSIVDIENMDNMDNNNNEYLLIFDMTIYDECDNLKLTTPTGEIIEFEK